MSSPKRRLLVGFGLLLATLCLQLGAGRRPDLVERVFAGFLYGWLGGRLACLTSPIPASLAELLLGALLAVGLLGIAREAARLRARPRRDAWRRLLDRACRLPLIAAVLYLVFLLLWGLNYQRRPFGESAGLEVRASSLEELAALCGALIEEANADRQGLPEDGTGAMRLVDGPRSALGRARAGFAAAAARFPLVGAACASPKPLLTSEAFSWLGITGIYSPFTGEANVNMTVPDAELPFSAAHELAHQRGFAREDEANYLGYLACRLHPDADFRYSGRLAGSVLAMNALATLDRAAWERIEASRSAGMRRDLLALVAWAERYRGPAERISERVNDAYLRSQGQAQGVRSYGRAVDLLLAERRTRGGPG